MGSNETKVQTESEEVKEMPLPTYNKTAISAIEERIMASLKCPRCSRVMYAPIYMCSSGHSVCARCREATSHCFQCPQPYITATNQHLENMSIMIPLPCEDCFERMPADVLEEHKEVCPNREYNCPVQKSCDWKGLPHNMLSHTSSSHPQQTWQKLPHVFSVNVSPSRTSHTYLIFAHGHVFSLHLKYDNKFQAFVRFIGPPEIAAKFTFKISLIKDNNCDKCVFFKNMCVDTKSVELLFETASCVSVARDMLATYLLENNLVCEVDILKPESRNRNPNIEALLQTLQL